ncbi:MAG: glucose-6-phosphate isomerase, partial [Roseovarius sp.]|nr:glucose-6-phosphate isomerase [Roseovarius sp.]
MWSKVEEFAHAAQGIDIAGLFEDSSRAETFSTRFDGMLLDYSKTALTAPARDALVELADASGVAARRAAMFAGEAINETEARTVLHTALRNLSGRPVMVAGSDITPEITDTRARMARFADSVRRGSITDVVNIGIGGSHLGPDMAVRALRPYHDGPRCHFVSN